MNFLFFTKKQKEKYYNDFIKENNESLFKLNRYCSLFSIVIITLETVYIDPVVFPNFISQLFDIRSLIILESIIVLIASLIKPLKKISLFIAFFFALSYFIYCANVLIVIKNDVLLVNTWIVLIVLFVGMYPIPVLSSIIIFLISYAYFLIFSIIQGHFVDEYTQVVFVNTFSAAIASAICKYFFMRSRQREFYAKKNLETANKEIKDLNEKLNAFDKIKTDFFSNISHEIRTPLTLILTPIESYFDGKMKINNMDEFLYDIRTNSLRLNNLINNLLDFSKLDAGRMNLTIKETDISRFLQNYIYSFKTSAELKGISLEFTDQSENLKIYIDQNKTDKVFMNLFSNALKFTETGGKIKVAIRSDYTNCYIEFADSGPGIPEIMKDEIFERFRQLDSGLKREHGGTGIGLSLAKEYMEMHGGKITLTSRYFKDHPEDHGSIFTLNFLKGTVHFKKMNNICIINDSEEDDSIKPIVIPEMDYQIKTKNRSINFDSSKPTILAVEDNPEMANFIADILKEDYNVEITENGKEAINKLNVMKIDLVLSDIMMPVMDGYTLLKTIRQDKRFSRLPVIMLTAKTDDKMKINSLENGANDYLIKPFNARELSAKIMTQIHLKLLMDKLIDKIDGVCPEKINVSEVIKKKLEYIIEFLNNNYLKIISRENLASTLDISPDYFSRMFKQHTGKKIQDYINELRIKHAAEMLASSNKKIIDIAMESGFETLRTFNRDFMKKMKISPSEYRMKEQSIENR